MPYVSTAAAAAAAAADQLDGDYPDLCPTRPNAASLRSTADYHRSLLEERQDSTSFGSRRKQDLAFPNHDDNEPAIDLPAALCSKPWKPSKREKSQQETAAARFRHPELTQQDLEEFEALPLAIRRKYFSTLERLRLAQTSVLNASPQHKHTRSNHVGGDLGALPNPRVHAYRGFNRVVPGKKHLRPTTSPADPSHLAPIDTLALAKLPAKIREKHLTREEQLLLAKQLRESVILDAADEAIYRLGRRFNPQVFSPTLPSSSESGIEGSEMDLDMHTTGDTSQDDLYDCFRWLDEDDELDLSLVLDDHSHTHPEGPEGHLPLPRNERVPSFRRHLSISKIPFGNRLSIDSSRPATNHAVASPTSPALSGFSCQTQQARRRSRAFSLISPRHVSRDSIASIDPAAAHYQDPEARLKLRVYLSSPQKFDEAIEFGFPSNDPFPADSEQEHPRAVKRRSHQILQDDSENLKTFLSDDHSSICSEDMSVSDPESPKTPHTFDQPPLRPVPRSSRDDGQANLPEGYAQVPVASREMTLRMTLTRPDLRSCEEQLYGWSNSYQPSSRLPRSSPFRDDSAISYIGARPSEGMDRIFADIDQHLDAQSGQGSVMRRLWKRVKRS